MVLSLDQSVGLWKKHRQADKLPINWCILSAMSHTLDRMNRIGGLS